MSDLLSGTLERLASLSGEVRQSSIAILNLGKSFNPLAAAGIVTVGALITFASEKGFSRLGNFGRVALQDVLDNLTALANSIQAGGTVDWSIYAKELGYNIIPADPVMNWSAKQFLATLPDICEAVIPRQLGDRNWTIFKKRLLNNQSRKVTLEEIGSVFQLTRERVRQIQEQAIDIIRRLLISNEHHGLKIRIRLDLGESIQQAVKHFGATENSARLRSQWLSDLSNVWHCTVADLQGRCQLIEELLSYEEIWPAHEQLEPLVVHKSTDKARKEHLVKSVDIIHDILVEQIHGCDLFDLTSAVNRKLPKQSPVKLDIMPHLVKLCSSVESCGKDTYRVKFEYIRSRPDQVDRILREQKKPMHYSDLCREINKYIPPKSPTLDKRNMVNQLTADPRFITVGKSGFWALEEWGTEDRSIVTLIEETLHRRGEAMLESAIFEEVVKLRPASKHSITMLLCSNPRRFRKIAPRLWDLPEWGDRKSISTWDRESLGKFIEKLFEQKSTERLDVRVIRDAFVAVSGLPVRSASAMVSRHPAITIERKPNERPVARFQDKWRQIPQAAHGLRGLRPDSPLGKKISDAVVAKLEASLSKERPLIEIVKELENELTIARPSIYAVISRSDKFETIPVDGLSFKTCRLKNRLRPEFPQIKSIKNISWRIECERAVEKLNPDDVDIGLFMLGRQFDVSMKELIYAAKAKGNPPVPEGSIEKGNLNGRIEWAIKSGIFSDRATVHLLRTERNERAHGHGPSASERSAIMKSAPFLAGLYIDYIIIVETYMKNL